MNLQRYFNKAVVLSFGLSLVMVFMMYFLIVNRTQKREAKARLYNSTHLHALSVDFSLRTFVSEIQAMGSRTVIRRELYRYTLGQTSLEELIAFTQPKYADGAAVIKNITGIQRVLTDGTPVNHYGDRASLSHREQLTRPGVFLCPDTGNSVLVVEAIIEKGDTIGFDAGCFRIDFLFDEKPDGIKHLRLVDVKDAESLAQPKGTVKALLPTQPFALVAKADPGVWQKRQIRSLVSVMIFSLVVLVVIAVIFYFTLFRWVKKVIERLRSSELLLNSTQKLTHAGGWEFETETLVSQWTRQTFLIFDMPVPHDTLRLDKPTLQKALSCLEKRDRYRFLRAVAGCIRYKKSADMEFPFTSLAGASKMVRIVLQPVCSHGRVIRVTGTIMDVTELIKAQQVYEEKLELEKKVSLAEKSLEFKQNFLANMSHELRTPLSGIIGMADILQHTRLNPEQQEYLDTIIQSGENLSELVDKILSFSRIEAGNIELNSEVFSPSLLMHKLGAFFHRICDKPLELQTRIDPQTPGQLTADENKIFEVAGCLISNAIKFSEKGRVVIAMDVLETEPETGKMRMQIMVEDPGIGIHDDIKEGLIDPFYKLDETALRHFDGPGISLAMSQRLVSALGGQMSFKGYPGKGSMVGFTFVAYSRG